MENKNGKYIKDKRNIIKPKPRSCKQEISPNNSHHQKTLAKIIRSIVASGIIVAGVYTVGNVEKTANEHLTKIESTVSNKDSKINDDLQYAELKKLIALIKEYKLEKEMDLNLENNNYIVGDNKLALDDYYLYEAINSPNKHFNEYIEVAFALPILNSKNIDKDSHTYKVARDLMIKNAMFLKDHGEKMVKDKLEEALSTIKRDDVKSNPDKYVEYSNLLSAVYNGKVKVERKKDIDSDAPILADYILYKDGEKDVLIAKSTKDFFSSEKPLITGTDNSIIKSAISRGEILESKQIYDARINELDETLNEKINSSELSNEEIDKLKSKIEKEKEKSKEILLKSVEKAAYEFGNQGKIDILKLDPETGNLGEKNNKYKNSFKKSIKNPEVAYLATQIIKMNTEERKKEEQNLDQEQNVEENKIEKNYEYVDDKDIQYENEGYGILKNENEEAEKDEKDKDDPYDRDI